MTVGKWWSRWNTFESSCGIRGRSRFPGFFTSTVMCPHCPYDVNVISGFNNYHVQCPNFLGLGVELAGCDGSVRMLICESSNNW